MTPASEHMDTTCPLFNLIISGRNSRIVYRWARVLTSRVFFIIWSDISSIGFPETIPALLTSTLTGPNDSLAFCPVSLTYARSETSHTNTNTLSLTCIPTCATTYRSKLSIKWLHWILLVSTSPCMLMSVRVRTQPSFASSIAMSLPMPLPAPVRYTCSPSSDFFGSQPRDLAKVCKPQSTKNIIDPSFLHKSRRMRFLGLLQPP